jgi:hypothetical protein
MENLLGIWILGKYTVNQPAGQSNKTGIFSKVVIDKPSLLVYAVSIL